MKIKSHRIVIFITLGCRCLTDATPKPELNI
jgi:hypothetical protein